MAIQLTTVLSVPSVGEFAVERLIVDFAAKEARIGVMFKGLGHVDIIARDGQMSNGVTRTSSPKDAADVVSVVQMMVPGAFTAIAACTIDADAIEAALISVGLVAANLAGTAKGK
jgi:hypothetical protein